MEIPVFTFSLNLTTERGHPWTLICNSLTIIKNIVPPLYDIQSTDVSRNLRCHWHFLEHVPCHVHYTRADTRRKGGKEERREGGGREGGRRVSWVWVYIHMYVHVCVYWVSASWISIMYERCVGMSTSVVSCIQLYMCWVWELCRLSTMLIPIYYSVVEHLQQSARAM